MSLEDINGSSLTDGQELQESETEPNTEASTENIEKFVPEAKTQTEVKAEAKTEDITADPVDQKLYDEILEKLDIKEKKLQDEKNREVSLAQQKAEESSQVTIQIEQAIAGDFSKIQKLLQAGLINSAQGQNLKQQVLKKAFDKLVQTEKIRRNLSPVQNQVIPTTTDRNEAFEEFSKSNPDFFTSDGRKEVLEYLKSDNVVIGKDDLSKISGIIRTVEKAAIDRYLKKVTHEKTLRDSNEAAKQRLTANAQKSSSSGNLLRTFTREQIGKMSSAEFAKYESSIMDQLKKGHIR